MPDNYTIAREFVRSGKLPPLPQVPELPTILAQRQSPAAQIQRDTTRKLYADHAKWAVSDTVRAGLTAAQSALGVVGQTPLAIVEGLNRAQQGMWAYMLGDEDWAKYLVWPEMEKDEFSGESGLSRAIKSIQWKFQGKEAWSSPIPSIFRPTEKPPIDFLDLLTGEKDPVKRAAIRAKQHKERVENMGAIPTGVMEGAVELLGSVFVSPDVIVGGGLSKLAKVSKAAKLVKAAEELTALEKRVASGSAVAEDISKLSLVMLKELDTPDMQAARNIGRLIKQGNFSAELRHDPRIAMSAQLAPALRGIANTDPDKLLPTMLTDFSGRTAALKKVYNTWWKSLSTTERTRRKGLVHEVAMRGDFQNIKKVYGKDAVQLAKIATAAGEITDVYSRAQKDISWLWFAIAEPKDVIPELYHVGDRARHMNYAMLHELKTWKNKLFTANGIERGSESDQKIFRYLDAKRERIVSYDINTRKRVVQYNPSPERKKFYANLTQKEKDVADAVDKFFEDAADKLGIADTKAYLQGYAPHIFPKDLFAGSIPQQFMGLQVAGNVMFTHLLKRLGVKGNIESIDMALDSYLTGYARKLTIQPALDVMKEINAGMPSVKGRYGDLFINEVAGKPGLVEKALDPVMDQLQTQLKWTRRPAQQAVALTTMMNFGMLAGNVGFLAKQMFQVINAAAVTSPLHVLKGLGWLATSKEGRAWAKTLNLGEEFARLREAQIGVDVLDNLPKPYRIALRKREDGSFYRVGDLLSNVAGFGDTIARSLSLATGVSDYAAKVKLPIEAIMRDPIQATKALEHGLRVSEATQFVYGVTGRNPVLPAFFGGEMSRIATMFQSYYMKQASFVLKHSTKDFGFALDWLLYTGMAQRLAASEMGIDATSFAGVGSTYPSIRWGQPPLASPPISFLLAAYGMLGNRNPNEVKTHVDNFSQLLGSAIIPFYLQGQKTWKAVNALQKQGLEVSGTGQLIQQVDEKDYPGLVLGLPLYSATQRRYAERMARVQQQREAATREELLPRMLKALEAGDAATVRKYGEAFATTGFGPDNINDSIKTLMFAEMYEPIARMFKRNKQSLARSGALGARLAQNPDLWKPRVYFAEDFGEE